MNANLFELLDELSNMNSPSLVDREEIEIQDFEEESIKAALVKHFPDNIDSRIYHSPFGKYIMTDKKCLFSLRKSISKIDAEKIEDIKRLLKSHGYKIVDELTDKTFTASASTTSRQIMAHAQVFRNDTERMTCYIDYNGFFKKFITKRQPNSRYKIFISPTDKKALMQNGYRVYSKASFTHVYNPYLGEYQRCKTHFTYFPKTVLEDLCLKKTLAPAGQHYDVNGNLIFNRTSCGRKKKEIRLTDADGNILKFAGYEDAAAYFNVSLSTVKRAFKGKSQGDAVTLRKKVEFVLS